MANLLKTYRGIAYPWLIDSMGHMNTQFYCSLFDGASLHLLSGIAPLRDLLSRSLGWATVRQLTAEETKSLIFGHELHGRQIESGDPWTRTTSVEGAVRASLGSASDNRVSRMEDDAVCTGSPTLDGGGYLCGVVFRNPGGTSEQKNEYLLVQPWSRFEFSVVK